MCAAAAELELEHALATKQAMHQLRYEMEQMAIETECDAALDGITACYQASEPLYDDMLDTKMPGKVGHKHTFRN